MKQSFRAVFLNAVFPAPIPAHYKWTKYDVILAPKPIKCIVIQAVGESKRDAGFRTSTVHLQDSQSISGTGVTALQLAQDVPVERPTRWCSKKGYY